MIFLFIHITMFNGIKGNKRAISLITVCIEQTIETKDYYFWKCFVAFEHKIQMNNWNIVWIGIKTICYRNLANKNSVLLKDEILKTYPNHKSGKISLYFVKFSAQERRKVYVETSIPSAFKVKHVNKTVGNSISSPQK